MNNKRVIFVSIVIAIILICYFEKMTKYRIEQENHRSDSFIKIVENLNGMAIVTGQNSLGSDFQIDLEYPRADVILSNYYFADFTGDNKKELCLEMNIWNSVSPNFNTILIYDIENDKLLFPSADKSFIYHGYFEQLEVDNTIKKVIAYSSFTKINGISVEEEKSTIGWNGNFFDTLVYQKKLLLKTEEYIVFYMKFPANEEHTYKLLILDSYTLETIGNSAKLGKK